MRSSTSLILLLLLPFGCLAHEDPRLVCVQNLRQINGAKQMLAIERNLQPGAPVEPAMLAPYFPSGTFPKCSAGGSYTIGPIGTYPVCSVPGHSEAEIRKASESQARHERLYFGLLIAGSVVLIVWVLVRSLNTNLKGWFDHIFKYGVYELQGTEIVCGRGRHADHRLAIADMTAWQIHPEMGFDVVTIQLINGQQLRWIDKYDDLISILRQVAPERELNA